MPLILTGAAGSTTLDSSAGLTFSDSSNQSAAASPYVLKNRIINGAMVIDQRNAGASVTPGTFVDTYITDRWFTQPSAASKYTIQQNAGSVTPPTGFTNYLGATSSSAYSLSSTDYFIIGQKIEGFNIDDLDWGTASAKTVTLSFWVRSSLTGTFGGVIRNNANTQFYPFTYTISSANTWEQKSITITGSTTGTWVTNNGKGLELLFGLGVGTTYSKTAGAWTSSFALSATGATSIVGTNGATWYITGVQLEVGSTATPFERRLYNQELANCQRYYEVGTDRNAVMWSGQTAASVAGFYGNKGFCVTKRTSPTCTFTNEVVNGFATGGPTSSNIDSTGIQLVKNSNGSAVVAAYWFYNWTASAEL